MPNEVKRKSVPFWLCLVTSICLIVAGFIVPPTGVVDGSVLTSCGILFGFATLAQIPVIIEVAGYVKMSAGNVTIEASKEDNQNNDKDEECNEENL